MYIVSNVNCESTLYRRRLSTSAVCAGTAAWCQQHIRAESKAVSYFIRSSGLLQNGVETRILLRQCLVALLQRGLVFLHHRNAALQLLCGHAPSGAGTDTYMKARTCTRVRQAMVSMESSV